MKTIKAASYNIRHCRGLDNQCDPHRIAEVLQELEADIIGLQEVDSGYRNIGGLCQIDFLAKSTGMNVIAVPTIHQDSRSYGNMILTRGEVKNIRRIDLTVTKREPRGAIDLDIILQNVEIRVISAHLGLRASERRTQINHLYELIQDEKRFMIVLGDFNEWRPLSRSLKKMQDFFGKTHKLRTFPASMPLLPLDRIWVQPAQALLDLQRHISPKSRIASDHLPIIASLKLP